MEQESGRFRMTGLAGYEKLFYGGIALMAAAAVFLAIFLIIYFYRGAKLRKMLDEEYGDPVRYNRGRERKR